MGTWLYTHTVTTTDVSPDLRELAEVLGDVSVQTMPMHYGWGCRTFQTASNIQVKQIWGIRAPSAVVDGHMEHTHTIITTKFGRVSKHSSWCKFANRTTMWRLRPKVTTSPTVQKLRLQNHFKCIPHPCHTSMRCLRPFSCWGWAYGCILTWLPPQMFPIWMQTYSLTITDISPDLRELAELLWCKCANHATTLWLRL